MLRSGNLDLSFSGLKTAVLTLVQQHGGGRPSVSKPKRYCPRLQEAMVDVLVAKSLAALEQTGLRQLVVPVG